ncbi:MAG: dihydroorotate dehydrogenase electron transfer subunit [Candidatus Omnitrophica bacterium]|nr:dihydroorotate dehydrogenase electron transfer subunit [Candidatus Omnitrophota bacterium]
MLKNQYQLKIASNKKITKNLYHMIFSGKAIGMDAKPGQFVHLRVNDKLTPFFRRPFGVFRLKDSLEILYDVVGLGTTILSQKKKGDILDVIGPLGSFFCMPPKGIKTVVLIAGGIGIAPLLSLSDALRKKKYKVVLLQGGRNKDQIVASSEFKKNGCVVHVSTDDGSVGIKGRVSKLFSNIKGNSDEIFIYACGPKLMIKSVQTFAKKQNICGQASLEEVMACGIGTCLGCSTKTKNGYKTVCKDGPVFSLDEVVI